MDSGFETKNVPLCKIVECHNCCNQNYFLVYYIEKGFEENEYMRENIDDILSNLKIDEKQKFRRSLFSDESVPHFESPYYLLIGFKAKYERCIFECREGCKIHPSIVGEEYRGPSCAMGMCEILKNRSYSSLDLEEFREWWEYSIEELGKGRVDEIRDDVRKTDYKKGFSPGKLAEFILISVAEGKKKRQIRRGIKGFRK